MGCRLKSLHLFKLLLESAMSSASSLRDLLLDQLNDLASAEQQLLAALPKMANAATGKNLRQGFLDHLEQTKMHAERLKKAFKALDESPEGKVCHAMKGLIEEGSEAIELEAPPALKDVALVGAARRVEHYEMAAYQVARGLATAVNEATVGDLLQQTLDEEMETDKRLCSLGDMGLEAARDLTDDPDNKPAATGPRKIGKKKAK